MAASGRYARGSVRSAIPTLAIRTLSSHTLSEAGGIHVSTQSLHRGGPNLAPVLDYRRTAPSPLASDKQLVY